jgi:hypothetical protein
MDRVIFYIFWLLLELIFLRIFRTEYDRYYITASLSVRLLLRRVLRSAGDMVGVCGGTVPHKSTAA